MKIIVFLLLLIVAGLALAALYLPWWASIGGLVLLIVGGKIVGGRIIEALFKMPFKAKGAVLRGATIEVHALTPVARPAFDKEGGEDGSEDSDAPPDANRCFYLLDVTVNPAARDGGAFQLWEPGELLLVGHDAKADDLDDEAELCDIKQIEIESEGRFTKDEGMKYGGAQRLRLTLAVAPEVRQLQFRYYFELFGAVSLPQ